VSDKSNKNDADFQNFQDFKKEMNCLAFIDGKRCSFEYTHTRSRAAVVCISPWISKVRYWFMGKLSVDGMRMLPEDYF